MASAIEELSLRMERMEKGWKLEKSHLESRLENKNQQVEKLESVVETMKTLCENKNEEVANLKKRMESMEEMVENRMGARVATLEKHVNDTKTGRQDGLRELPYLMVCAFQNDWRSPNSVVPYDRITTEYNNADQPGGEDITMIIIIPNNWKVDDDHNDDIDEYNVAKVNIKVGMGQWTSRQGCSQPSPAATTPSPTGGIRNSTVIINCHHQHHLHHHLQRERESPPW